MRPDGANATEFTNVLPGVGTVASGSRVTGFQSCKVWLPTAST